VQGSVELRKMAGSVGDRSGERFGRSGVCGGARFQDAPARSAVRGSGPRGGMVRQRRSTHLSCSLSAWKH
jgi:hypothetical protein